ncbi:MAG: hypothetical protein U0840_22295 [Gemmataceae bacterium]
MRTLTLVVALSLGTLPASAQGLAPLADVEWSVLRPQVRALLTHSARLNLLPPETVRTLEGLLASASPADPASSARAVQKLLDAHCLVGVHINPESRVKAARGALAARLVLDRDTHLLVRVHNEGGVTHPLVASSDQARAPGKKDPDRWLDLALLNDKPFANRLTGHPVEYRILRLTPRQAGKREATLMFDVGQGTQDLGFRSEVPILFTIRQP